MSVDDPRRLRVAAVLGTVWNTVMAWGALFIGLAGRAAYGSLAELPGADKENVFPALAADHLHPLLLGLVLASVLAAIMSTADSQLLVAASAVVRDMYQKVLRRKAAIPPRRLVLLSRLTVAALVAAAIVLGMKASEQVFWLVLFAWGGLGASFGPAILLALFWKGTTRWGVAAGLITGTVTVILWKVLGLDERVFGQDGLYELIPAFFLSLAAVVAGSLCGRRNSENRGVADVDTP
jgi:Na+/proline symporter